MPGPILDSMLAQLKYNDVEKFGKRMELKEAQHDAVRPAGDSMTIEEVIRRRAENIDMDFVGIPQSSEEVEEKKEEERKETKPMDSGSNQIMKDFLNKLKG